ncbi:MAG: hypothetical protein JST01_03875 [Cyanobacteria bacterium SZAS TMP-1]|nr:hypothetical protein [Cyanobacteria bacterium SZAS TMP-1]
MHYRKPSLVLLAGFVALGGSVSLLKPAGAQGGLLQRIQERREERQQDNSQQGQPQQGQQQQMPPQQMGGQQGAPDISTVTLQTQMGPSGQQMVITPKGYVVPLPGSGVNGSSVQIYMAGGGIWYVDRNNQQVDLTAAVRQMQATMGQNQTPVQPPQYAPPPQQYSNSNSGSSQGNGAMTAAVAGGLGAMAGAAMTSAAYANSSWNNVPYGVPVRYGAAAPYYNQGGKPVYINNSTEYHTAAVAEQQNWYKQQQVAQGAAWKSWQQPVANPFVAEGGAAAAYGAEQGQQAARYGAAAGATADYRGHQEGQQAAQYGAAAGATADYRGHEQGQQDARAGAAAGATADYRGHEQGQQDARFGAAAGASADRRGGEAGEAAGRFGAAGGARAAGAEGRFAGARGGRHR